MTYFVNKYDGTQIAAIAEGAMDTTSTSIKLLGRDFVNYGEVMAENLVHLLEHFAGPNPPAGNILTGQLWFNTNEFKMYVYNSTDWILAGGVQQGNTDGNPNQNGNGPNALPPSGSAEGELFWDADTQQLWGWTQVGTPRWVLVGPAAPDTEDSKMKWVSINGNGCLVMIVNGVKIAIWSSVEFTPTDSYATDFPTVYAGLTFRLNDINDTVSGRHFPTRNDVFDLGLSNRRWNNIYGKKIIVDQLQQTNQPPVPFEKFMRTDRANSPDVDNTYALGSSARRYSGVYAGRFYGRATSADYADIAERYKTDTLLEAGDVVMIGGEEEITKTKSYGSLDVFGIVSERPAFRMNEEAGDENSHPFVAFSGRLPCKVVGTVKKGQRLVSSGTPGVAVAVTDLEGVSPFAIIGRALADKNEEEIGLVEVVVGKN